MHLCREERRLGCEFLQYELTAGGLKEVSGSVTYWNDFAPKKRLELHDSVKKGCERKEAM